MGESQTRDQYRAARSVHLWWKRAAGTEEEVVAFYNEVRVEQATPGSYFMACGFEGGYFGIQEMCDSSHRVLFSVWDASSEMYQGKDDPRLVPAADRVEVLHKAEDVLVQRFGGEGTGAQCLDDASGWRVGDVIGFLVECRKSASGRACYAAYIRPELGSPWKHLATYCVACGKPFRGFYSFIEDFRRDHHSTLCERRAHFGPAWLRGSSGVWMPAVETTFTASGATWERPDNIDVCTGPAPGTQTLATGGDRIAGSAKLHRSTTLASVPEAPPDGIPTVEFPEETEAETTVVEFCLEPLAPACPLCGGGLGVVGGPYCGGGSCEPLQCLHADPSGQRCVWRRGDGTAALCHYHTSSGRQCPLCGGNVDGQGPYCLGDCCASNQCQRRSPFPGGGRCPFPCSGGVTCSLHRA